MSYPDELTRERLRDAGYTTAPVEFYIARIQQSRDLFGVADVEALADDHTLYVQVCRDEDLGQHFATCLQEPRLRKLLACPARRFEIWAWAKVQRGRRKLWRERRYLAQLTATGRVAFVELGPTPEVLETPMGEVHTSAHGGAR